MKSFKKVLSEQRRSKGLSQKQLADLCQLSRTYVSLLESSDKKAPSLDALRRFCEVLAAEGGDQTELSGINGKKAFQLVEAALRLDLGDPFKGEAGDPVSEGKFLRTATEVWVFTDILAENVREEILNLTVESIRERGVNYRYFVQSAMEWLDCQERLAKGLGGESDQLLRRHVAVFETGSLLCLSRIAIFDPGQDGAVGTITVGPPNELKLRFLRAEQVERISHRVRPVVDELMNSATHTSICDNSLGAIRRLFP